MKTRTGHRGDAIVVAAIIAIMATIAVIVLNVGGVGVALSDAITPSASAAPHAPAHQAPAVSTEAGALAAVAHLADGTAAVPIEPAPDGTVYIAPATTTTDATITSTDLGHPTQATLIAQTGDLDVFLVAKSVPYFPPAPQHSQGREETIGDGRAIPGHFLADPQMDEVTTSSWSVLAVTGPVLTTRWKLVTFHTTSDNNFPEDGMFDTGKVGAWSLPYDIADAVQLGKQYG